jgi:hypothetical protein
MGKDIPQISLLSSVGFVAEVFFEPAKYQATRRKDTYYPPVTITLISRLSMYSSRL